MIRILISIVLFYLSFAIVVGTLADFKSNPSAHPTSSGRFKSFLSFFSFALMFLLIGWFIWPNSTQIDRPRYYIGAVTKSNVGTSYYVRIKRKLNSEQLASIIKRIEKDSSNVNIDHIAFFRYGQSYRGTAYAIYKRVKNDDLFKKLVNTVSNNPEGIVYY